MNNKILRAFAMIGTLFLFIDCCTHGSSGGGEQFEYTSLSEILSVIYISAWMCSVVGLKNIHASGNSQSSRVRMMISGLYSAIFRTVLGYVLYSSQRQHYNLAYVPARVRH